ncbi:MAG: ribosome maturation factor RimM [Rhodocyclaceae bacterium]|nr:ribosome maturation factor RimM [Rhodocyclaceae bacterium]
MIVLGRITAPYGVKGWLRLHPFGDDPASWRAMPHWWLGKDDKDFSAWRAWPLLALKPHGKEWLVRFAGIEDRTAAEALAGSFAGAPREALPATAEGEYYWADLIGLRVVNERGEPLGTVRELIETGAHAVLVVEDGEQERLLPFVGQVVKDVDGAAGRMVVAWEREW